MVSRISPDDEERSHPINPTSLDGRYLGLALLLSWFFGLWFSPKTFGVTDLLAGSVTLSWIVMLVASVVTLFATAAILKNRRHLPSRPWFSLGIAVLISAMTLFLSLSGIGEMPQSLVIIASIVLGISDALLWIAWVEFFGNTRANFAVNEAVPTFGIALLATLVFCAVLPSIAVSLVVALLPIASSILLIRHGSSLQRPPLLPREERRRGLSCIVTVCVISFLAAMACYFLLAIIPASVLPADNWGFLLGAMGGAVALLCISGIISLLPGRVSVFGLLPWLLFVIIVAYALYLSGDGTLRFVAFLLAASISTVFEILLVIYFAALVTRGYTAAALAFAFAAGFTRLGIVTGNLTAILFENDAPIAAAWQAPVTLVFLCLLAAIIIPLVRQEYAIVQLTTSPADESDLDRLCDGIVQEYGLSKREADILPLLARGLTAENIANKLVISVYTVNTHTQHIYEKMDIHKRSELLEFLHRQ